MAARGWGGRDSGVLADRHQARVSQLDVQLHVPNVLTALSCTLKMLTTANFVLCVFPHHFRR